MSRRPKIILVVSLWVLLITCAVAWPMGFMALIVLGSGPHYSPSEWHKPEVVARMRGLRYAEVSFFLLPGLFLADVLALWILYRTPSGTKT